MRLLLISCLLFISSTVQAEDANVQAAHKVHEEYSRVAKTAMSLRDMDQYLTKDQIDKRNGYIAHYQQKKNMPQHEVEQKMLMMGQHRHKCTGDLSLIEGRELDATHVMLTYGFSDSCSTDANAKKVNRMDVTMVKYKDTWKIQETNLRPETPIKIREVH